MLSMTTELCGAEAPPMSYPPVSASIARSNRSGVSVCKVSSGAAWVFEERKSLPLTVV